MINFQKHSILIFLLLLLVGPAKSQEPQAATMFWVKENQTIQANGFYFNVLRIDNSELPKKSYKLKILPPDEGKQLTPVPAEIWVDENAQKSIPFRYAPSKACKVDSIYQIVAILSSEGNEFSIPTTFKIEGVHSVKLNLRENALTIQPEENHVLLTLQVTNEGDYSEDIILELELSNELGLADHQQKTISYHLTPGKSITEEITIKSKNSSNIQSGSFEGWIGIDLINGTKRTSKKIPVSKLDNVYDNFGNHQMLKDNRIEYYLSQRDGFGFSSNILAEGTVATSKGQIAYGMQLRDAFGQSLQNFLDENYFELNFQSEGVSYGLGTSTFDGLSGLYKRNSLFIDKAFRLNNRNRVRLFANEALNQFDLGLAAGHEYITKNLAIANSVGWNTNERQKTKSLLFENSSNIYAGPFSALYRGNYTNVSGSNSFYNESTYTHTLKMDASFLDEKLKFNLSHRLLDSDRNSYIQKTSYLFSDARYLLNDRGLQAILRYSNSSVFQDMRINKSKSTSNVLRAQSIIPLSNRVKLTSGMQLSDFSREIINKYSFAEKNANLFTDLRYSFSRFSGRSSVNYGLKSLNTEIGSNAFWGANTELEYSPVDQSNLFAELNYSDGATQIYRADRQTEIEAQLGMKQALPGKKNYLTVAAYYRDSPISAQSPLSMKAGINFWTPGNININVNVAVKSNNYNQKLGVSNIEARVVKHFNWKNEENDFFDLEILFFKDENGNNLADKEEGRIPGVKVMLTPLNVKGKSPVIASLVSSDNGVIKYKNLEAGSYKMKYFPISNLNGYYNFDENEKIIELFSDQQVATGFSKAGKIYGAVIINRSQFSSFGGIDLSNIRITATNEIGKTYSTLTDKFGNYTIYIPQNQKYELKINNLFGDKFEIKLNETTIDLTQNNKQEFNFEVSEKKRKINFAK